MVKKLPANAGDLDLLLGLVRSSEERNDIPLQYSFLGNSMDRGAWQVTVHGVARVGPDLRLNNKKTTLNLIFFFFLLLEDSTVTGFESVKGLFV